MKNNFDFEGAMAEFGGGEFNKHFSELNIDLND
jgi:hypothetical protein